MNKMRCLLWLVLLLLLAGCTTPPSRFYVLTPQPPAVQGAGHANLVVGVGPVRLVDYLERPQIVARNDANRLTVEEFDRWGGSLEANIGWVMAENLSRRIGSDAVVTFPWERAVLPSYQIAIDIRQFDSLAGGEVYLAAQWRIMGEDGRALLAIKRSDIREPFQGDGLEPLIAAQSRALARMSDEIAAAIDELYKVRRR